MKSIMYHYVQQHKKEFKYLNILLFKNFEKQVSYFLRNFYFFDVKKIFDLQKINKKQIFLTFDDGLKSHFKVARFLKKKKLNAIFFVPALNYKKKIILNVHKVHILLATQDPKVIFQRLKELNISKYIKKENIEKFGKDIYKNQSKKNEYLNIKKILNFYLSKNSQQKIISKIFYLFFDRKMEKKIFSNYYLSKDELKKMIKMKMLIGGHSSTHRLLTLLDNNEIKKEIENSKNFLRSLGVKKYVFSYPYGGKKSYNRIVIKFLKYFGFKFSFSVMSKNISISDIKRKYHLPRYNCNDFRYGKVNKHKYN